MNDQRVSRQLHGVLGSRTLTLRAATSRERQDQETRELVRYKLEEVARKEMKETEKQKRAQADKELLFLTVPIDDAFQEEDEDSQEHSLLCTKLKKHIPNEHKEVLESVKYANLFENTVD